MDSQQLQLQLQQSLEQIMERRLQQFHRDERDERSKHFAEWRQQERAKDQDPDTWILYQIPSTLVGAWVP